METLDKTQQLELVNQFKETLKKVNVQKKSKTAMLMEIGFIMGVAGALEACGKVLPPIFYICATVPNRSILKDV